jgi:hypothetical protein
MAMSVDELLAELSRLDRADKLRAMQVLMAELASEQGVRLTPGGEYEVWSPYDAADAAVTLTRLLESEGARRISQL